MKNYKWEESKISFPLHNGDRQATSPVIASASWLNFLLSAFIFFTRKFNITFKEAFHVFWLPRICKRKKERKIKIKKKKNVKESTEIELLQTCIYPGPTLGLVQFRLLICRYLGRKILFFKFNLSMRQKFRRFGRFLV